MANTAETTTDDMKTAGATNADAASAGQATANAPPAGRAPTKLSILIELLLRAEGASIAEMMAATGWQAHSVRGAMAGALRKRGHAVVSSKAEDGVRRYRIGDAA